MYDMQDPEMVTAAKERLADRYTSSELCELLEVPVEDIIEEYWVLILRRGSLFVGELECPELEETDD